MRGASRWRAMAVVLAVGVTAGPVLWSADPSGAGAPAGAVGTDAQEPLPPGWIAAHPVVEPFGPPGVPGRSPGRPPGPR